MRQFVQEAFWDLRGNRTNNVLSFVALFTAMLALVVIIVLSRVGTDSLVARSEQLDGRAVTYSAAVPTTGWSNARAGLIVAATARWTDSGVTGSLVLDSTITAATSTAASAVVKAVPIRLRLVSDGYRTIRRIPLVSGRWFSDNPFPGEVVVNAAAATQIGDQPVAQLDMGTHPDTSLRIVGVVSDGDPQATIYGSIDGLTASTFLGAPDQATLLIHTSTPDPTAAAALARSVLRQAGVATTTDVGRTDQAEQIASSLATVRLVFLVLALLTLLVAILGMINVGVAAVRERTRDLTIRRAMGATRARVAATITLSTTVVGLVATACATAASYVIVTLAVPLLIDDTSGIVRPAYPWPTAAAAAAVGLSASLLSGLIPAVRTRGLDLAAVLRA